MKTYISIAAVILVLSMLTGCKDKSNTYDASGMFEATEVIVSAQANGEIMKLDIAEGMKVESGTQLGYIDTTQLHLKKMQIKSSINAAGSRQVNVARQIAALQEQINTQKREQKRFSQLVARKAANQKQLDDINSSLAMLEKQLAAQTETFNNSNNSLDNEQQSLVAQLDQIEDQIQKAIIKSPVDGTVMTKYAETGEVTAIGKPLFKVADLTNIFIRIYVTAPQLTLLKLNQPVKVFADKGASDRQEYEGHIIWISDDAEFTPKTVQTREERANLVYAVKVAVSNDGFIKLGMYGDVEF